MNKLKKRTEDREYLQLKNRIVTQTFLLFVISAAGFFFAFKWVIRGHFADAVVNFLNHFILHDYDNAYYIYDIVFRRNMDLWVMLAAGAVFLIMLRIYLNSFTRYFREINRGIDAMVEETAQEVKLSPELVATEEKINHIIRTLEQRRREAREAEQKKNDVVMYLAHDLRTPMTSVIGYLSLLNEAPDMPAEQKQRYTRIALEKAERLESLVEEFFEITRYNFQQIRLEKDRVDLHFLLQQLTEEFYPLLKTRNNQMVLQGEGDLVVWGDGDKLARVFNNILKNAVSYSDPDTEISVTARREEQTVRITVRNQGPDIPASRLNAIFDRFVRMDAARSTNRGGAGLGLAIAKEIVQLHGGTISVSSANRETAFQVTLPVMGADNLKMSEPDRL